MEYSDTNTNFTKIRIIKNLAVISVSFLLIFTAYDGLSMLQTTMNKEDGVGTVAQAIMYTTYGISSLLLSSYVIKKLGTKNTQLLGMSMYVPYVAANFYPSWITLVPSAVIIGIGSTLLWGAQCTYFNECSVLYKELTDPSTTSTPSPKITYKSKNEELSALDLLQKVDESQNLQENCETFPPKYVPTDRYISRALPESLAKVNDSKNKLDKFFKLPPSSNVKNKHGQKSVSLSSTNALFFGFHGLAYCSAQVWSNLISFYVLSSNQMENYNKTSHCSCGADFCNTDTECVDTRIEEVPTDVRYIYTGVCVACGIVSVLLIWLFVDHVGRSKGNVTLYWNHIFTTVKFIKNKEQLFLIPVTICTSMLQGLYTADFTKSYIACSWSTSHVGLVTVFYGFASALSSFLSGLLIRLFGRRIILILCQTLNIVSLVLLYLWTPDPQQPFMLYLAGGIYGFIVGIFHSQTKALYGVFFQGDEETAFSSCSMYSSIGWALPFVYGEFFCTAVKLGIMFTIACLGLIGYLLAERSFSLRNEQTESPK